MERQSVKIGVDRLCYALMLTDNSGGATYDIVESIPGTTEVGITQNNSVGTFYADDGSYETYNQQGDIELSISLAGLSQKVRALLTGASYSVNGLATDGKADNAPNVAIGFRTQKANGKYRYVWVYKGKFSKSDGTHQTKTGTVTTQTEQYSYKALHREYDGKWRQMLDSDDENLPIGLSDGDLYNITTGWFSSPNYVPVAPGTPISDLAAATSLTSGAIDLTFSAPTGATSVKAQVNDPTIGVWTDVTTEAPITASSTSAKIIGLTAGNTYSCRLVVIGGASNGTSNADSAAAGA